VLEWESGQLLVTSETQPFQIQLCGGRYGEAAACTARSGRVDMVASLVCFVAEAATKLKSIKRAEGQWEDTELVIFSSWMELAARLHMRDPAAAGIATMLRADLRRAAGMTRHPLARRPHPLTAASSTSSKPQLYSIYLNPSSARKARTFLLQPRFGDAQSERCQIIHCALRRRLNLNKRGIPGTWSVA
jgi:hypothetical protein